MNEYEDEKKASRNIPIPDKNLLWQNSAGRCAKPDCRIKCAIEATDTDDAITIGEMAHIFAHSKKGPRPNPDLYIQERNSYDNLILLCGYHHTLVDGQQNTFTVT